MFFFSVHTFYFDFTFRAHLQIFLEWRHRVNTLNYDINNYIIMHKLTTQQKKTKPNSNYS